jgi:NTP pyrophosphatase (non-canonical NTP hydrolase)
MTTRDKTIAQMTAEVRTLNIEKGWRNPDGIVGNTLGDYIALLHTEVAEATEAYRDHRLEDATLPHCAQEGCPRYGKHVTASDCGGKIDHKTGPGKPEGVGSELADTLIRLLDTADVFQLPLFASGLTSDDLLDDLDDLNPHAIDPFLPPLQSFGDHMAWLSRRTDRLWVDRAQAPYALRAVVTVARKYGFDLATEYERKMTFNRTRPYRHGGRTIADGASA